MRTYPFIFAFLAVCNFSFSQNVGIGTTTPGAPLHIKSLTCNNPLIIDGNAGSYYSILENGVYRGYWGSYSGNAEDVDFGTGAATTGKLHLTIQAAPKLTIDDTGNVGIDITSPTHRLHLNNGDLFIQSSAGSLRFGYEGSNQWKFPTTGGGADFMMQTSTDGTAFTSRHYFSQNGNVGIGTGSSSPTEGRLEVWEPAGNTQFIASAGANLPGISTFVPSTSPSIGFNARYNSGYKFMGSGYGAFFQYSPSVGRLYYYYSSTNGVADGAISSVFALAIDSNGRLGIGTSVPTAPLHVTGNVVLGSSSIIPATGYKLSVDGKVLCEELKIQLSTGWPDYVFKPGYKLIPLDELERSIVANEHLPNMPSAADIGAKKGFEVGDMNRRLLEKVEELTLYIIEISKQNKRLSGELESLKAEINILSNK